MKIPETLISDQKTSSESIVMSNLSFSEILPVAAIICGTDRDWWRRNRLNEETDVRRSIRLGKHTFPD